MKYKITFICFSLLAACSMENTRLFPQNDGEVILGEVTIDRQEYSLLAGGDNSCYLYEEGRVKCWGRDDLSNLNRYRINKLTLAEQFACGTDQESSPFCVIQGESQKMAITSFVFGESFVSLAAGSEHVCGINSDSQIVCWGDNSTNQASIPAPIAGRKFLLVAAGYFHSCGISTEKLVYCWGKNDQGQSSIPDSIRNRGFTNLSLGESHSCGLTEEKEIYCWGSINLSAKTTNYHSFASGRDFICALNYQQDIECWFKNDEVLFSTASENNLRRNYLQIAAGHRHLCASTTTRKTFCWGNDDFSQLDAGSLP